MKYDEMKSESSLDPFRLYYEAQILKLVQKMGPVKGDKILDAGCGNRARFKEGLESLGYSYVGIDRDVSDGNAALLRFDFDDGFPSLSFNHLICVNSLQTFGKPYQFCRHLARAIQKNGQVLITLPNRGGLHYGIWKVMDKFFYREGTVTNDVTEKRLLSVLSEDGFHLEEKGGIMAFPNQLGLASPRFLQPLWIWMDQRLDKLFKGKPKLHSYTYFIFRKE